LPDRDIRSANRRVIDEFRANGGVVGGYFAGISLLLLTTTGARSGRPHISPLSYLAEGGRYFVAAAAGGAAANPAWFHNLIACPEVTVEVGDEAFEARAAVTTGEERDVLFERFTAQQPQLAVYQSRTTRQIPMVAITASG
jgi:deazaflavin-dependent oxidoreductase (nitroreductase family)